MSSPLPTIKIEPAPIGGMCSQYLGHAELAVLIHLFRAVAPKVVVEFGVNSGVTASRILEHIDSVEQYVGIDVGRGHKTTLSQQQSEVPLIAGHRVLGDTRFVLIKSDSVVLDELPCCDCVFIDGSHDYATVISDSVLADTWLRPGGIIVWHDYGNQAVEVTKALDFLHGTGWPIEHVEGTWLALMRNREETKS